MTRDEIVALFERRNDDWNRQDAAAVAGLHEEDAVAESPISGRLVGRRSIEQSYTVWMNAFPDMTIATDEILIDGDRVAQFFTLSGTQTGPFGGMPATGRRMQITGVFLATLSPAGRIKHDKRIYDVTNMLVQLGALKTKPAT
jgi:steroid delta-isomerase-like uncharacterized protein